MSTTKNNVYFKLMKVQSKLKCEKSQYNKFGGYAYRSTSDILEAVKPLLSEVEAVIIVNDELKLIGDRYYVEATAMFLDCETGDSIVSRAIAREAEGQKGMSEAQVTGSSSSYARKYALNALLLIDDTKDDDFNNKHGKDDNINVNMTPVDKCISDKQLKRLYAIGSKAGHDKNIVDGVIKKTFKCEAKDMTKEQYDNICERLEKKAGGK